MRSILRLFKLLWLRRRKPSPIDLDQSGCGPYRVSSCPVRDIPTYKVPYIDTSPPPPKLAQTEEPLFTCETCLFFYERLVRTTYGESAVSSCVKTGASVEPTTHYCEKYLSEDMEALVIEKKEG